jgi:hypothetical protein
MRSVGPAQAPQPDLGVVKDARRRQRRRRVRAVATSVVAAVLAAGIFLLIGGGSGGSASARPVKPPEPLPPLSGPALVGPTRLVIVAPGSVLDLDHTRLRAVPGLGLPVAGAQYHPGDPLAAGVTPGSGGALLQVTHDRCGSCAVTDDYYTINAAGTAREVASVRARPARQAVPALGQNAVWVLDRPRRGHCVLHLVPGRRASIAVPCGALSAGTRSGPWIGSHGAEAIVDARTGRVRRVTVAPGATSFPLSPSLALELTDQQAGGPIGLEFGRLDLVDLASGATRRLTWPSWFPNIIRVAAEARGPLVAVDFGSPAYPGPAQAEDVWILDTSTGRFDHLPGYPAQVRIKFSDIAWTKDNRLVIAAASLARTVVGVWKPGERSVHLRSVPAPRAGGYWRVVALTR